MPADAVAHESLDLGGWYASDAAGFGFAILQNRMRNIVPVTHAAFVRMRRAHPVAAVVEAAAGESVECFRAPSRRARSHRSTSAYF
jgi:hypothetical protein